MIEIRKTNLFAPWLDALHDLRQARASKQESNGSLPETRVMLSRLAKDLEVANQLRLFCKVSQKSLGRSGADLRGRGLEPAIFVEILYISLNK